MPSIRERLKERFSRRKAETQETYSELVRRIADDPKADVDLDEVERILEISGVDENQLDRDVGIIRRERELDAVIEQGDERKEALREVAAERKAANDEFDAVRAAYEESLARLDARSHAAQHRVNQVESAIQEKKGLRGKLHSFTSKERIQLDRVRSFEERIEQLESEIEAEQASEEPSDTVIANMRTQISRFMSERNKSVREAREYGAMREAEANKYPV